MEVGETVVAFGNPFGLENSITKGIISGKGRAQRLKGHSYFDLIQTDALINPGNSGGPLVNLDKEVVAINAAIVDPAKGQGLSFAIPINKARRIVEDLMTFGEVPQSWVGLQVQSIDENLKQFFKLTEIEGVMVTAVESGSPAEAARLAERDVITHIDGTPIPSKTVYWAKIREYAPKRPMKLQLLRPAKKEAKQYQTTVTPSVFLEGYAARLAYQKLGIEVRVVDKKLRRNYGILATKGLVITKLRRNGVLFKRGVRVGDVLSRINQQTVSSESDFQKAMFNIIGRDFASLLIQRGEYGYILNLEI